ncbi:MAG: RNA methyltransferase [Devosia sp.]
MPADFALLEPAERAEPFCPYFGRCGGCTLQHFAPPSYLALKQELVAEALRRAHLVADVAVPIEAHGDGRRRATFHARGTAVGYMARHSHDLIDIAACPILVPALESRGPALVRPIAATIGDCDVALTATDTGLDVAVRTERKGVRPERLTLLAQRSALARLSLNGETVLEARAPALRMSKAMVEIPTGSFLQATAMAEQTLAQLVVEGVGGAKSVADLFCGLGPFALRLAETTRVFAADSDRAAIAALQKAANHAKGLKPIAVASRDLFRDPLAPVELGPYDAVVFDPPRAGAEAQARELARSKVKTVVAVSCEPRTFARDAAILVAGGYRLETVTPVDQFAWSMHVEMVGVFRR